MLNLSLNELKLIAKNRGIKDYKSISKEILLSALNESKLVKESENDFDHARIKKVRNKFNKLKDRFSKPKMKKIKRTLYEIENKKNLVTQKIKEIEKSLFESAKNLSELKKYYYHNDIK